MGKSKQVWEFGGMSEGPEPHWEKKMEWEKGGGQITHGLWVLVRRSDLGSHSDLLILLNNLILKALKSIWLWSHKRLGSNIGSDTNYILFQNLKDVSPRGLR